MKSVSTDTMLNRLAGKVEDLGGQALAADHWGVSPQYVSMILGGVKRPSRRILGDLGLSVDREVKYRYFED